MIQINSLACNASTPGGWYLFVPTTCVLTSHLLAERGLNILKRWVVFK